MNKFVYKSLRQKLNFDFQVKFFQNQIVFDLLFLVTIAGLFQTSFALFNIFLIPSFMFRQFSILHEAVHNLSHSNGKINQAIGVIAGAFCLTPFTAWKTAHLKHHYWTGNLKQDPTFSILKYFQQSSRLKKYLLESTWKKGVPFLAALQHFSFWILGFKSIRSAESVCSLLVPLMLYTSLGLTLGLINSAICLIGVAFYLRMYEEIIVPQHVGLYSDDNTHHHPPPWEQPYITRSWYMPPVVEKYIVLNMNYHTEHHLFPDLPWHQLDTAHKLLLQESPNINMINSEWMKSQRQRPFSEVIVPVPSRKKTAA